MKKTIAVLCAGIIALSLSGCGGSNEPATPVENPSVVQETEAPAAPEYTASQEQAIKKAELYLITMPFSRQGLIDQLVFDKFTEEDATFAVDNIEVDWNEQAALKGKAYLDMMPMSRDALIDQLMFDKFTPEQAASGATANGL